MPCQQRVTPLFQRCDCLHHRISMSACVCSVCYTARCSSSRAIVHSPAEQQFMKQIMLIRTFNNVSTPLLPPTLSSRSCTVVDPSLCICVSHSSSGHHGAVARCAHSPGERDAGRGADDDNRHRRPPLYKRAANSHADKPTLPTLVGPRNSSKGGNSRPHTTSSSSAGTKRQAGNQSIRSAAGLTGEAGSLGQRRIPDTESSAQSVPRWQQQQDSSTAGRGSRGNGTPMGGRGRAEGRGRGRGDRALPAHVQASINRTEAIKAAANAEQLLVVVQRHTGDMDHINLSAAYTCTVRLCKGVVRHQQSRAVQQLLAALHQLAQQLQQQCGARALANIIWSCGRLRTADTAEMLLPVFLQDSNLQQAAPQGVANVVLAAATLQLQLQPKQWQLLLQAFDRVLEGAKPQEVSNTIWAIATMGRSLPQALLQRLVQHFQRVLLEAKPQAVSNTLWAVATMQQQLPPAQLQQLMQHFQRVLPEAKPQAISNTLWALATMQQQVPPVQLQQVLQRFVDLLPHANPQDVSNTLWACGKLQYAPRQLLSALEQNPQQLQTVLTAATPQSLANMAWACGQVGYRGKLLPGAVLQQVVKLVQGERNQSGFSLQELCNLCWSAAVLNMQQQVPSLLQVAAATKQLWQRAAVEELQQLYQVHLWLLDSQLPAPGQGLLGVLSQQQLEQCRASWEQLLRDNRQQQSSDLEQSVLTAVRLLPQDLWQQQPTAEEVTSDGLFSIDIAARTASGVKVAIEVDGPSHFMRPDNTLEGGTLFRNRALAARAYVVVSIPYWEWNALKGAHQKQEYLLAKLTNL